MKLELSTLPDEIIICILSQSIIDLNTLGQLMSVSRRVRHLALHIFNQYRLPYLQLSITIDQEGKNRIISKFQIDNIDPTNLSITFNNTTERPRRYYSNRASPMIRSILMTDKYDLADNNNSIASSDTYSSLHDDSDDSSSFSSSSKEHNLAAHKELLLSAHVGNTTKNNNGSTYSGTIINHNIQKKKEGLHILQVPRKPASWKLSYKITEKEGHQYHLLPSTIKIQLNQLILLENVKRTRQPNKKWGLNIIKWVSHRSKAPYAAAF